MTITRNSPRQLPVINLLLTIAPSDIEDDKEPCLGCGDGDKVPANGYWRCPVCDAEWHDESEQPVQPKT